MILWLLHEISSLRFPEKLRKKKKNNKVSSATKLSTLRVKTWCTKCEMMHHIKRAKAQMNLCFHTIWNCILGYPKCTQWGFWLDSDLNLLDTGLMAVFMTLRLKDRWTENFQIRLGCGEGVVYLTSLGHPTDIGLQSGKSYYPCSR